MNSYISLAGLVGAFYFIVVMLTHLFGMLVGYTIFMMYITALLIVVQCKKKIGDGK